MDTKNLQEALDEIDRLKGIIERNKEQYTTLQNCAKALKKDKDFYKKAWESALEKQKQPSPGDLLGSLFGDKNPYRK